MMPSTKSEPGVRTGLMNAAYAARRNGTGARMSHYFWRLVEQRRITPEDHEVLCHALSDGPTGDDA